MEERMEVDICLGCMKEKTGEGVCPHCGFDPETYQSELHHLTPGSVLNGKYLVGKVLGEGGFGITYVGWDLNLHMKVAIKEYYPNGYVTRTERNTGQVTVLTGKKSEYFYKGQEQFVEEARRLAKFWGLPGIVAVKDYFQENGTAYIVMEFVEGETLKEILARNDGRMETEELLELIRPVLRSLQKIHAGGLIHRDISPDNLMLDEEGNVKLLDFGAARSFIAESEKSLSVILKPGFAPEEQYRSRGNQGPWTDVYALSATIYRAITGTVPVESLDRLVGDDLPLPSSAGVSLSAQQEAALMKGLAVLAKDRFQSVKELEEALYEGVPVTDAVTRPESRTIAADGVEKRPEEKKSQTPAVQPAVSQKKKKPVLIGLAGAAAAVGVAAVFLYLNAEYPVTVTGGEGTAEYKAGAEVMITAEDREAQGYRFSGWEVTGEGAELKNVFAADTSFVMPRNEVTVEALYEDIEYLVTVENGTGSGMYIQGTEIMLEAQDRTAEGYRFVGWEAENAELSDAAAENTSFVMPAGEVSICALYELMGFEVSVENGSGEGTYTVGSEVVITAEDRTEEGYVFTGWQAENVELTDASAETITFIMPKGDVSIVGVYEIPEYKLTVIGTEGSGTYEAGSTVTLKTADMAEEGYCFVGWEGLDGIAAVEDLSNLEISFVMPEQELTVEACYEQKIIWSDPYFGKAVQMALGYDSAEEVDPEELSKIKALTIIGTKVTLRSENYTHKYEYENEAVKQISGWDDLKYFTGLDSLWLPYGTLDDLEAVGQLNGLETLSLSGCEITDDMIAPLGRLTNLETLYLDSNEISDVTPLSTLTKLEFLDLDKNNLSSLKGLESLTDLKELSVSENADLSEISALIFMNKLEKLNISYTAVSDISALGGLTGLVDLELNSNEISDVTPLASLTGLTNLGLIGNNIADIDTLEALANLEVLNLANNKELSDISAVSSMKKLGLLSLSNTSVRDISALSGLNELFSLNLEKTYVEDLSPVSHIPDLKLQHSIRETTGDQGGEDSTLTMQEILARLAAVNS